MKAKQVLSAFYTHFYQFEYFSYRRERLLEFEYFALKKLIAEGVDVLNEMNAKYFTLRLFISSCCLFISSFITLYIPFADSTFYKSIFKLIIEIVAVITLIQSVIFQLVYFVTFKAAEAKKRAHLKRLIEIVSITNSLEEFNYFMWGDTIVKTSREKCKDNTSMHKNNNDYMLAS